MRRLLKSKIQLSEEEKSIIEKAPLDDEPLTDDYLSSLIKIKSNHSKDNKEKNKQ